MSNEKLMAELSTFKNAQKTEESLSILFMPIAKRLILGGYLAVYSNGQLIRRVYPHTVEFYYHEETKGGIKDYIVYHRNQNSEDDPVPYFPVGSINAHRSGIDITFEEKGKYRASALIRAYRVEFLDEQDANLLKSITSNRKIDTRSTYLYDYLFTGIQMPISLQWEDTKMNMETSLELGYRENVFEYEEDGSIKIPKRQDCRLWAFSARQFPPRLRPSSK